MLFVKGATNFWKLAPESPIIHTVRGPLESVLLAATLAPELIPVASTAITTGMATFFSILIIAVPFLHALELGGYAREFSVEAENSRFFAGSYFRSAPVGHDDL